MASRTFLKKYLGVLVNGKPLVSKTRTGGSIPSTPDEKKCGTTPAAPVFRAKVEPKNYRKI